MPSGTPSRVPLDAAGRLALVDVLGDTPETVIALHVLRRGVGRAYLAGDPPSFAAAVVVNLAFDVDELMGFGDDAVALWTLLSSLRGWSCISVAPGVAASLGELITTATGTRVRYLDDVYHALAQPVARVRHEAVRLLTPDDDALLELAAPEVRGSGFRSARELLTEGVAAAAVVTGRVVAIARTSAWSEWHADIGVATLPAWRGQGFATAAASLVAERVQTAGQTPVWSTGEHNLASRRVAQKLGFAEVARRTYVILEPA